MRNTQIKVNNKVEINIKVEINGKSMGIKKIINSRMKNIDPKIIIKELIRNNFMENRRGQIIDK